jgi:hypothetical protein
LLVFVDSDVKRAATGLHLIGPAFEGFCDPLDRFFSANVATRGALLLPVREPVHRGNRHGRLLPFATMIGKTVHFFNILNCCIRRNLRFETALSVCSWKAACMAMVWVLSWCNKYPANLQAWRDVVDGAMLGNASINSE